MICKFVKGRQNGEHHRTLADINHDILLNYISNSIRILIQYCIQNHENGKGYETYVVLGFSQGGW